MSERPTSFNALFPVPQLERTAGSQPARPMVALSIRQPYIELILRGVKRVEYRSVPTRKRERVYLYASRIPADAVEAWDEVGAAPGDLVTGMLVGTVEIVNCTGKSGDFRWHLAHPERLAEPLPVSKKPQPMFFYPW